MEFIEKVNTFATAARNWRTYMFNNYEVWRDTAVANLRQFGQEQNVEVESLL